MTMAKSSEEAELDAEANPSANDHTSTATQFLTFLKRLSLGIAAFGVLALIAYASQFAPVTFLNVVGAGTAVGAASAGLGALVGFLFGVPKSLQNDPQSSYADNTNLDQISDWLTKILVGIGLVQIAEVPRVLGNLASDLAPAFGDVDTSPAFALSFALYFAVGGLLIAYLWTAVFYKSVLIIGNRELKKAIEDAQNVTLDKAEDVARSVASAVAESGAIASVAAQAAVADDNAEALALVERQLTGDSAPTQDELNDVVSRATPEWRVQIFQRAEEVRSATWQKDKQTMSRTMPVFRALVINDHNHRYFRHFGSLGYTLKDQDPPDYAGAIEMLSTAIDIKNEHSNSASPYLEYNRAVCRIMLDPNFTTDKPSSNEQQVSILSDLKVAAKLLDDHYFERGRNPEWRRVADWMQLQGVTLSDLRL